MLMVVAAVVLMVSIALMQRAIDAFTIRRPTIPAIFYITYLPMIFFPSFWVYIDHPGPFRDIYIISVITTLLTIPLGIIASNKFFKFEKVEIETYFMSPVIESFQKESVFRVLIILVLLSVGLAIVYFFQVPVIPIIELISHPHDEMTLTLAREASFKLLDPRWGGDNATNLFYAYLFLRTLLFPVLIMITLGYFLYYRSRGWLIMFVLVFAIGGFYAASSLSRAPISAIFMRILFFLYLYFCTGLSKKIIISFAIAMLVFPLMVTTFAYNSHGGWVDQLVSGVMSIVRRLTYTPADDLYYYFEIFPAEHDFLLGGTLLKPFLQVMGQEYFYIENYVALYISPEGVGSAHANAAFLSNLYADFGYVGVVFGGIFAGMLMQALQIYISRGEKSIFNITLFSFIVYAIWVLNFGSITSVLFVNGIVPIFMLLALTSLAIKVISKIDFSKNNGAM